MRIAFLAPEVWPFTPLGGLGEMAHELPNALAGLGNEVHVISLKSGNRPPEGIELTSLPVSMEIPISWRNHRASVYAHNPAPGVKVHLIYNQQLFEREGLYGNAYGDYEDNGERFIFYSRAALELMLALDMRPDIVHVNNWTSGLVPLYLKSIYSGRQGLTQAKSLLTVHNLVHQGIFWHYDMPLTGLGWEYFNSESLEFYGKINLLKAGMVAADRICFTSRSYAQQALAPEHGHGLDGVLQTRKNDITWVINGVNQERCAPENGGLCQYSASELDGKEDCRRQLRQRLSLPASERPLLGLSGRLASQRGFEEIAAAMDGIMEHGFDVAFLGQGEHSLHMLAQDLKAKHKDRFGLSFDFSPEMARLLLAGSDMLLVPGMATSEQNQYLKAQLYGTIPVALRCGAAADTIVPPQEGRAGTGFLFDSLAKQDISAGLSAALSLWADRARWQAMMRAAMAHGYTWRRTAENYNQIYQQMLAGVEQ